MTKRATIATAAGRSIITIDGVTHDGFALIWRGEGRAEFRRTAGGPAETVAVRDIEGKAWPEVAEADVISLTHPDAWTSPAEPEAAEVAPVAADADPPVAAPPDEGEGEATTTETTITGTRRRGTTAT